MTQAPQAPKEKAMVAIYEASIALDDAEEQIITFHQQGVASGDEYQAAIAARRQCSEAHQAAIATYIAATPGEEETRWATYNGWSEVEWVRRNPDQPLWGRNS